VLRDYRIDLHIHSCLSPCGDWEMSPRNIVRRSREAGLDLIAVSDHNSCENAAAVMAAGRRQGLAVLPGMEICSREEVHLLAVFESLPAARAMQQVVYESLAGENRPEIFGFQIVANEKDEVLGQCPRLLIGATSLTIDDVVALTHRMDGLSIAAHVDRPAFGLIGQLGFIPPRLGLDGLELAGEEPAETGRLPCLSFSDAHRLADIGRVCSRLRMAAPIFAELGLALRGELGRGILGKERPHA
jgi:PHP family Zn ribbon phosphoesterase